MCGRAVGGAKIKDKILVLENLIDQADRIMCIGGMAYTFLKVSQGMAIGSSLFDKKGAEMVPRLLETRALCAAVDFISLEWHDRKKFLPLKVGDITLGTEEEAARHTRTLRRALGAQSSEASCATHFRETLIDDESYAYGDKEAQVKGTARDSVFNSIHYFLHHFGNWH